MASTVLLLLLLLNSSDSLPPPRTSFLLNSSDRPLVHFRLPTLVNTTTLLLSPDGSTLYVGARDVILSLDVSQSDVIKLKRQVRWSPSDDEVNSCRVKGKNPTVDCPNFVHVLQQINSSHLYACGSFAYNPHDAFIDADSLSMVHRDGAKGRCPFSPFQRSVAVADDGELFTASTVDFRGVKPQISRHFSRDGRPDVSLDSSVSLLEEPSFVGAALDRPERKLYFFFSEVGKEFSFVDELRIARVAQVCKNDVGGQRTLQRKWTSFAKALLLCQAPKQLPFSVLHDVFSLPPPEGGDASDALFYGLFTSQWFSGPQSAVCVFKLQDIKDVFAGSYRTFDMKSYQWSPLLETHAYLGQCGLAGSSDSDLAEVKRTFLTSGSVRPVGGGPIVVSSEQRFNRVAVMKTQAANGKHYIILFLLTDSGFLHKVVLSDRGPRVIEEIQVYTEPQTVRSLVLSSSKGVLYVGTSKGVTAVPVSTCSTYTTCTQCVLARDPLCGWSRTRRLCSGVDGRHDDMVQQLEDGGVEDGCGRQMEPSEDTVSAPLNRAVTLRCVKPSNMAALTWTSPRFQQLPEDLFIQSADSSLRFLATPDTFGTYRCEAEEGGFREVVARYDVRQVAPPRSMSLLPKVDDPSAAESTDGLSEDVLPEEPVVKDQGVTTGSEDWTDSGVEDFGLKRDDSTNLPLTFGTDSWSRLDPSEHAWPEKSYRSELVVVSLLLATCCCITMLAALHVWRQKKTSLKPGHLIGPQDSSAANRLTEASSLSSPEEAGPQRVASAQTVQLV
ncbi:semaphorin-4A-like [Brachyistius frenatus]|uniref:semaphorin-4A-like n=1 Tax=Brachyistius frenatus TaxID=100188 RepID=UPI0037E81AAA